MLIGLGTKSGEMKIQRPKQKYGKNVGTKSAFTPFFQL